MSFPYSYYRCPCADDVSANVNSTVKSQWCDEYDQEQTFALNSLRSKFSLYPLDHLMWCEDCHDIRCQRCTAEEIVCWYCPSCLFEVASSMVKSEGNRCTRNCFDCPACTSPLSVNTLDTEIGGPAHSAILACEHCNWTTLDIGIQFEKPTNIFGQLSRLQPGWTGKNQTKRSQEPGEGVLGDKSKQEVDARFSSLKAFYKSQHMYLGDSSLVASPSGSFDYDSPSSLARIMSLYTSTSTYGKKATSKSTLMRESADSVEGLHVLHRASEEFYTEKMRKLGWSSTTTIEQRSYQLHKPRFIDGLRPIPTLLRTKRSKRCRTCRHILVKPEAKISSTRYRIKLIALNYIPSMVLKPLITPLTSSFDLLALPPSKPIQFLLTIKNQMFDQVKVTLATPSQTCGRFSSRVIILCPQFEVGANTDVWDEALGRADNRRTGNVGNGRTNEANETKVAEAGKVWERGRNWTTVVVEVMCIRAGEETIPFEDDDVLEVPLFVRIEYEVETTGIGAGIELAEREKKEKKELAYWAVLGAGKIAM